MQALRDPLTPLRDLLKPGGPRSAREFALVATDVDGTLTRSGSLEPAVLGAIARLVDAGITVWPVSGRPTGEVMGLCRYLPGVSRGLAENGLLEVIPDRVPRWLGTPTDKARLKAVGDLLNAEHGAGLELTADDFCRLGDVAYERAGREEAELLRLRAAAEAAGVHLIWSNVHVHLAEAIPDKGAALLHLAGELGIDPATIVTVGDAPNDAGLFVPGRFGLTVGTADVGRQRDYFPHLPQAMTAEREAAGFIELAEALLAGR
ncbi:MAG: HAD family phosphatase [Myxococcales bacterium]|nr:HAD family phosphatase [Myxococcales bacterium]